MVTLRLALLALIPFAVVGKLGDIGQTHVVSRKLQEELTLSVVEGFVPGGTAKLGVCQGECSSHEDCGGELMCYHRRRKEDVPGCTGEGTSGTNYCFQPRNEKEVIFHPVRPGRFQLEECHGSCMSDLDCSPGLQCFRRDGEEGIPGCTGTGRIGSNICYNNTAPNALVLMAFAGQPLENFPLGICEGHCSTIKDCELGLVCFDRGFNDTVPDCVGQGRNGADYCIPPQKENELVLKRLEGREASVSVLGECEGECTQHSDCGDGLKCFFRAKTEQVPGCVGRLDRKTGYCFKATEGESLIFNGFSEGDSEHHLGVCEGDCRNDSDCEHGLVSSLKKQYVSFPWYP